MWQEQDIHVESRPTPSVAQVGLVLIEHQVFSVIDPLFYECHIVCVFGCVADRVVLMWGFQPFDLRVVCPALILRLC